MDDRTARWQPRLSPAVIAAAVTAMIALATPATAAAANPFPRFRAYIATTFGVRNPRYSRCPQAQRLQGGLALCEAQFRQGPRWRYVSAGVRRNGTIAFPFTRTWVRRWRGCPVHDRRFVPGTLRVNNNDCGGASLMASDIQHAVLFRSGFPRRAFVHGTNTAGFGPRVEYRCVRNNRTARCVNQLGDSFRYTVPAADVPGARPTARVTECGNFAVTGFARGTWTGYWTRRVVLGFTPVANLTTRAVGCADARPFALHVARTGQRRPEGYVCARRDFYEAFDIRCTRRGRVVRWQGGV